MNQLSFFEDKKEKSTDWKWTMENDYPLKNGLTVFSCFACGGGSTMGYKLAGCDVLGCNEIDPRMNKVYVANHHPKYNYLEDIRDFNKREDLPEELYNLDILDGSPPCSTFSMVGQREDTWGKEKKFREGQKLQTLDDLLFIFIDAVAKLKPKVAILENVEGLTLGNAWKYVQEIYKKFNDIGYRVKHWLLKGETMGVPQTRHRVFFVATRLDFDLNKLNMYFDYELVLYGEYKEDNEKIANGENIWCIYQDEQEVDVLPINKSMKWKIRENNLIVEEDWFYPIKYLFNSRSEAEHYLHHTNITRTEMLPFLTWEEFLSIGIMTFAGVNNLDYELVRDAGVYNAITIYENGNELFEYDLTEENFYKAYDDCVRLFKGEESK